jgi:hypothetical protein
MALRFGCDLRVHVMQRNMPKLILNSDLGLMARSTSQRPHHSFSEKQSPQPKRKNQFLVIVLILAILTAITIYWTLVNLGHPISGMWPQETKHGEGRL